VIKGKTIAFDRFRRKGLDRKMRFLFSYLACISLSLGLAYSLVAQTTEKELKSKKSELEGMEQPVVVTGEEVAVETVVQSAPRPLEPWDLPKELDAKVKLKKIYDFLNDPAKTATGGHKELEYEFKYFNHGAVTQAQRESRKGHYYVVNWSQGGAAEALTLRFDYRQQNTRDKVNTVEIPYPQARGSLKGTFAVTGESYRTHGDVISWRISVVRNGKIVAEQKSFVW
jgi:hypothetical protein